MATHFTAGQAALWAQIDGPNTSPRYLGCHQLGDIDKPGGDIELIQCPDPASVNRFRTVGSIQGAPGAITTTVTADVTDELDWLEQADCPFTLFVHKIKSGRRDVFTNFDRSFVLTNARITSEGLAGLAARTPDDNTRSEQTFDLSAEDLLRLFEQTINRQSISGGADVEDITFCNSRQCRTDEDVQKGVCELGFAVANTNTGSPAGQGSVIVTENGATWTDVGGLVFSASEIINGVECFEMSRDTVRVIVARGTTDGANPAEIGYSDDHGDTWTHVDVGAVDGQYAPSRFSLFALDRNNIWLGTQNGYIYKSEDGGLSWTAQQSGAITSGAINCIRFVDENIGWFCAAGNIIGKTVDGGESWSAVTGPAAQAGVAANVIEPLDRNRAWIGYNDGDLYYTLDAGVNWSSRSFTGSGTGNVADVVFLNDVVGYLAHNNASNVGSMAWTIDGGFTWSALTTPANSRLYAIAVCDQWNFYVVGDAYAGSGFIAKATV